MAHQLVFNACFTSERGGNRGAATVGHPQWRAVLRRTPAGSGSTCSLPHMGQFQPKLGTCTCTPSMPHPAEGSTDEDANQSQSEPTA